MEHQRPAHHYDTYQQEDQEVGAHLVEDDQYFAVELNRGQRGFGFSIRGGREFHSMPLFVLRMAVDGPAALDGRLMVGDQLVEINGQNTKNMTHGEAIELIKNGGQVVRLLVKRGKAPPSALLEQAGLSPTSPTPVSGRPVSAMSQPNHLPQNGLGVNGPVSHSSPRYQPYQGYNGQQGYQEGYQQQQQQQQGYQGYTQQQQGYWGYHQQAVVD